MPVTHERELRDLAGPASELTLSKPRLSPPRHERLGLGLRLRRAQIPVRVRRLSSRRTERSKRTMNRAMTSSSPAASACLNSRLTSGSWRKRSAGDQGNRAGADATPAACRHTSAPQNRPGPRHRRTIAGHPRTRDRLVRAFPRARANHPSHVASPSAAIPGANSSVNVEGNLRAFDDRVKEHPVRFKPVKFARYGAPPRASRDKACCSR